MMSRRALINYALVGIVISFLFIRALAAFHKPDFFLDFRPMYCAGAAILGHHDPYTVQPLRSCEITHGLRDSIGVMPAPVPGYVLAPFTIAALLPYNAALLAFVVLALAALVMAIWMTARMSGLSLLAATCAMFWTIGYFSVNLGQLSVFAATGIVGAAYAAKRGWWSLTSAAACIALLQPQLGLPIVITLAAWFPRSRRALAIGIGVLILLSFATLGPDGTLRYFTVELKHHAASETYWPYQLSLTWLLAYNGIGQSFALIFGSLSYLIAVALGILAARLYAQHDEVELSLLSAAAFATFGGSFIHDQQVTTVVPLGLILVARAQRAAIIPALGLALISVDLSSYNGVIKRLELLAENSFAACAVFLALLKALGERTRAISAFASVAVVIALAATVKCHLSAADLTPHLTAGEIARIHLSGGLASDQWQTFVNLSFRGKRLGDQLVAWKLYTWLGSLLLLGFALAGALVPTLIRSSARDESRVLRVAVPGPGRLTVDVADA
jgi:hypothetical protein